MDDIWDEPAIISATAPRNEPLFLPSDDEELPQRAKTAKSKQRATRKDDEDEMDDVVGDLFDDLIDANDVNQRPDMSDLLAKRAKEKDASKSSDQIQNDDNAAKGNQDASNEGKEGKPRRRIAKVDDERLLGERGIPALIKEAKRFKPKGKGHEAEDLERLLGIYQFWSHNMFPKTQFRDTVDRVERVCRSRRMLVNLSMWRDAERPKVVDEEQDPNKSDDSEQELKAGNTNHNRISSPEAASRPPAARRAFTLEDEDDIWKDMDDVIAEVGMVNVVRTLPPKPKPVPQSGPDEDDLENWFNAESEPHVTPNKPHTPQPPDEMDIDAPKRPSPPKRYLSPPTVDNWDEDLFV